MNKNKIFNMPDIHFYFPREYWSADIPKTIDSYWRWASSDHVSFRQYEISAWILQTYLYLKQKKFPCRLTGDLPSEGIVIGHRFSFDDDLVPNAKQFLICVLADKRQPYGPGLHPYAQYHIVQNPLEAKMFKTAYYIPHWPQPDLIPRDTARGDVLLNVASICRKQELSDVMDNSLLETIKKMGLSFYIIDYTERDRWNDFSHIDAFIAVRSFKRKDWTWKPATKLFNAWHAGVPAILGCESAYRAERRSELDYIEVHSPQEIIEALKRLRNDKKLYRAMVDNCKVRARQVSPEVITEYWMKFLADIAMPAYEEWRGASVAHRNAWLLQRRIFVKKKRIQKIADEIITYLKIRIKIRTRLRSLAAYFTRNR